jgi:acylphosphatase
MISLGGKIRARLLVAGRVQGVRYRESCRKKAQEFGVSGWVSNLADGRVEALFEGEKQGVERMVEWAKRGPFWAKVSSFELNEEEYRGEFEGFEIRRG